MTEHPSMPDPATDPSSEIARLNDQLRAHVGTPGPNRVVMTSGIAALVGDVSLFRGFHKRAELMRTIRDFIAFGSDNDPHGEHDLGAFEFEDVRCFWKIDYYDLRLSGGSADPANPDLTIRVLTIMRQDEW